LKPASSDLGSIFKDDSKTVKDVSDSPLAPKKSFADELASKIRTTEPPAQVGNKKTIKSIFSSDSDEDDGLFSSRYDPLAKGSNKIPSTLVSQIFKVILCEHILNSNFLFGSYHQMPNLQLVHYHVQNQ